EAGERADKIRDRRDFVGLEDFVAAESRHAAGTALVVTGARAIADGLLDIRKLAAPQPFIVVEIGVALGAPAARAMARRAVVRKGDPPLRPGKVEQLRIGGNLGKRRTGELVHHRTALLLE